MELHIRSILKEEGNVKEVQIKEIHNITLKDGHVPTIGPNVMKVVRKSKSKSTWHVEMFKLEPAIWFKVMIVDVVIVDCDKR